MSRINNTVMRGIAHYRQTTAGWFCAVRPCFCAKTASDGRTDSCTVAIVELRRSRDLRSLTPNGKVCVPIEAPIEVFLRGVDRYSGRDCEYRRQEVVDRSGQTRSKLARKVGDVLGGHVDLCRPVKSNTDQVREFWLLTLGDRKKQCAPFYSPCGDNIPSILIRVNIGRPE